MAQAATSRLEGGPWTLVGAVGMAALADPRPRLTFASGQLRFDAPCNAYVTEASVDGNELSFMPFPDMPKVCGPEAMALETALLNSLARVTGFVIEPGGDLVLESLGNEILRARR